MRVNKCTLVTCNCCGRTLVVGDASPKFKSNPRLKSLEFVKELPADWSRLLFDDTIYDVCPQCGEKYDDLFNLSSLGRLN